MIGLGSNRLTVCRRGGMSVTQAGRGGMEWLAGNGLRERTPYSVQATAALKAAFTAAQWATIRDYGFAHPEIVGYMNAYAPEDAKIAYSLVPVLGIVRWLIGDGSAYINTGYSGNQNSTMKIKFQRLSSSSTTAICGHRDNTNTRCLWIFEAGSTLQCGYGNQYGNMTKTCETGKTYIVETEKSTTYLYKQHCVEDNTDDSVSLALNNFTNSSSSECLYRWSGGSSTPAKIAFFDIWESGVAKREMYPFIRKINGVDTCGMIDVLSGTFYQNAGSGSFTISETPAS